MLTTAVERELRASAERLATLQGEIRSGRLARRLRRRLGPKTRQPIRGVFLSRILDPDQHVAQDWQATLNGATYDGVNDALEAVFRSGTQRTAWYLGIISATSFTGVSINNTMASHSGWSEFTGYTAGTRPQWSPGAAAAGVLVNSTVVTFTNGGSTASIQGIFTASDNTKGGAVGKLWATAPDASPRSLAAAQTFQVIYEVDFVPQ
jgi:hypothetical protein